MEYCVRLSDLGDLGLNFCELLIVEALCSEAFHPGCVLPGDQLPRGQVGISHSRFAHSASDLVADEAAGLWAEPVEWSDRPYLHPHVGAGHFWCDGAESADGPGAGGEHAEVGRARVGSDLADVLGLGVEGLLELVEHRYLPEVYGQSISCQRRGGSR